MYDLGRLPSEDGPTELDRAVSRAADALAAFQKPDGHWVFELEADATIPAEYLLLKHYLGEPEDRDQERKIANYLRRIQGAQHGGWPLYEGGAFDISATVKAYYALKMAGDDVAAPHMARARAAVLAAGGAGAVNVFTKIQLALFGAGPWSTIPTMPPEIILLPRWFPIHLSKMSYWARTVIVPLLVLQAKKPVARNARGVKVDELFAPPGVKPPAKPTHQKLAWKIGFEALDVVLKAVDGLWPKGLRARAIARCEAFVVERLNGEDGLGAIYPAMANSVMMFDVLGLCAGPPSPRHRPHVGRETRGDRTPKAARRTRSTASPACRRCGIRRWRPTPCWRPEGTTRRRAPPPRWRGSSPCRCSM